MQTNAGDAATKLAALDTNDLAQLFRVSRDSIELWVRKSIKRPSCPSGSTRPKTAYG